MSGYSGWTVAHLDQLREVAAAGTLEITFADGRRLRFQSQAELMATLRVVEADLMGRGLLSRPGAGSGTIYTSFERC